MSTEAILGIITLCLTALGLLCGGVWWMSALYSKVGAIQTNTGATSRKLDTLTEKIDGDMHEVRRDITDLQIRMVRVEGVVDTEEE